MKFALAGWRSEPALGERQKRSVAKIQPDKTKLNDADREELDELEKTQRDIAELLEKIAPAFQPPPADPEKK